MSIKLVPYYEVTLENIRQYIHNAIVKIIFAHGTGEMNQCLRPIAALAEDLSSIPSTHMAAHIYLTPAQRQMTPTLSSTGASQTWYIDVHAGKTPVHIK